MITISISEGDPSVHSGFPGSTIDTEKLCVPSTTWSSVIPIVIQSCEPILEPAAKVTSNGVGTTKSDQANINRVYWLHVICLVRMVYQMSQAHQLTLAVLLGLD